MSTNTQNAVTQPSAIVDYNTETNKGIHGNGRYSQIMCEFHRDSVRLFGLSDQQAYVAAKQFGVDVGGLNKAQASAIQIGVKADKDGKRSLKEIADKVRVSDTWTLQLSVVMSTLDKARRVAMGNELYVLQPKQQFELSAAMLERIDELAARL